MTYGGIRYSSRLYGRLKTPGSMSSIFAKIRKIFSLVPKLFLSATKYEEKKIGKWFP